MTHWDANTDVIVVGSGVAGLSAAIEAKAAGARIVVFEKMRATGGNTRISDGGLAAPGNDLQRQQGIADSPELFAEDMLRAGLGLNNRELVKIVAQQATAAVDWTRKALGVAYQQRLDRFGGHSVARCLTTRNHTGADLIKAQIAKLARMGVTVRTRCQMTDLIIDPTGAVSGVRIRSGYDARNPSGGTVESVRASRGVVLASGGFGNDVRFRTLQNPHLTESVQSTNQKGATAEALIAALKIHAAPVHLSWIQLGPWGCADETGYGRGARFASYCVYPNGILVDPATGGRIVNEWADRRQRAEAIFNTGHPCVGIVDAAGAADDPESLSLCLKSGKVRRFDTPERLADAFGMPADRLTSVLDAYNETIRAGRPDPFGKRLSGDARLLQTGPLYAIRLWPKVHYTPGGVGIDTDARVLDLHHRPIARLFAAGEVCGGIHGASRLGSCALPECIVFGRIAGRNAAGLPPR